MKVQYRRVLWATFFLIILFALVAGYFGRHFIGIGPVPARSAFAGRLPGTQEGDRRRFQFFYATNRANNDDTFNYQGNELGDDILTGTFDVLISPYMPIAPFVWLDTESMEWADRHELQQDKFQSQLRQAVQASPQKSVLVIVWGFRDWFH